MTDKRIGKIYTNTIKKLRIRLKKSDDCMKRSTNNPDYIYMLGNSCIKPNMKKFKSRKTQKKYRKHKHHNKSHKRRLHQKGGIGGAGNFVNSANSFTSALREVQPPPSVLPWEGHFSRNFANL